jgi:hypothetical protein
MLETVVISFAALLTVAIISLLMYAAHQRDLNLRRRFDAAETGGHPLSPDERAAVKGQGWDRVPPGDDSGWWYSRYRRRRALTRTDLLKGVLLCAYLGVFAVAVRRLGFALGFIVMYLLGLTAVAVLVLTKRRTGTGS